MGDGCNFYILRYTCAPEFDFMAYEVTFLNEKFF
jgi:hypothetical protein